MNTTGNTIIHTDRLCLSMMITVSAKNIGIIIGMILAFRQNQLTDSDIAMQLMQRFSLSEDEILDYMRAADEADARGDIY